ncbi:MAG TPA: VWA domain-containing protein [Methyloceanibacter sp.]|nr:VWA domain-containing protein [Methyloceanibacter sp.]
MAEPKAPAKAPAKTKTGEVAGKPSSRTEVDAFLNQVRGLQPAASGRGRLIFAMDATMSRQPTWDLALSLQSELFSAVKEVGGLDIQLMYFRGFNECRASRWVGDTDALASLMRQVHCEGGHTQIRKVLSHARQENEKRKVNALVYVGDCMEEDVDHLSQLAGELGLVGVPVFLFQEGDDPRAARAFKEIARLSRGAHCRFDAGSAAQLRELLTAVAVYATGGRKALETSKSGAAVRLLEQLG